MPQHCSSQPILCTFIVLLLLFSSACLRVAEFLVEQCKSEFALCPLKRHICIQDVPVVREQTRFYSKFPTRSKYAIFSINIPFDFQGTKYTFFIGLTAKMWSRKDLGFTPVVVFVVEYRQGCTLSPKQAHILQYLKQKTIEAQGIYIVINQNQFDEAAGTNSNAIGSAIQGTFKQFQSATIAQVSRIIASTLPFDEDDYLMTADAGMLFASHVPLKFLYLI